VDEEHNTLLADTVLLQILGRESALHSWISTQNSWTPQSKTRETGKEEVCFSAMANPGICFRQNMCPIDLPLLHWRGFTLTWLLLWVE